MVAKKWKLVHHREIEHLRSWLASYHETVWEKNQCITRQGWWCTDSPTSTYHIKRWWRRTKGLPLVKSWMETSLQLSLLRGKASLDLYAIRRPRRWDDFFTSLPIECFPQEDIFVVLNTPEEFKSTNPTITWNQAAGVDFMYYYSWETLCCIS